jgi:hypothetical protein
MDGFRGSGHGHRDCWDCVFLEADLKTELPRKLTFTDPALLFQIAERGGYRLNLEGRQAIALGIENRNGSIRPELTEEKYQKLRR